MRGRDADVVVKECEMLLRELDESRKNWSSASSFDALKKSIEEVKEEAANELRLEKGCERWIRRLSLIVIFVPFILSIAETLAEFVTRPSLDIDTKALGMDGTLAVVTGGCSGMGREISAMLEEGGAVVFRGCRTFEKGALRTEIDEDKDTRFVFEEEEGAEEEAEDTNHSENLQHLDLRSFDSVARFAREINTAFERSDRLRRIVLIHNAGTFAACSEITNDGFEVAFQINVASPYLLTRLVLDSSARRVDARGLNAASDATGVIVEEEEVNDDDEQEHLRVVFVTCDAALVEEDFLPWPLKRVAASALPTVSGFRSSSDTSLDRCDPSKTYANSKLMTLAMSNHMFQRDDATFLAVNPGPTDSGGSPPEPSATRRGIRYYFFQYFPPFFVVRKVKEFFGGVVYRAMLRSARTGASAQVHAATSLSARRTRGVLLSDQASSLTDCVGDGICGAVAAQPKEATDERAASELESYLEDALRGYLYE
eukprot:g1882.t1